MSVVIGHFRRSLTMKSILQKYYHLGDNIFSSLDSKSLWECQTVCKDWRQFFENPMFWLKMLRKLGQSTEVSETWKRLIIKDGGLHRKSYAACIRLTFHEVNLHRNESYYTKSKLLLESPPLLTASKYGYIEIVKLIYDTNEDYNRAIYIDVEGSIQEVEKHFEIPLFVAIENHCNEVAKFILYTPREKQNPSHYNGNTPLARAIMSKNLELVKFLAPRTQNLDYQHPVLGYSLIHLALNDYEILKYLVSVPGINPNLAEFYNYETPLQKLSKCNKKDPMTEYISSEKKFEMIKILAPLAKDTKYDENVTPLHDVAKKSGQNEILAFLTKYFDVNLVNDYGLRPIDCAILNDNADAVRILASVTKKLKINADFLDDDIYENYEALQVVKSLIEERKKNRRIKRRNSDSNGRAKKKLRESYANETICKSFCESKNLQNSISPTFFMKSCMGFVRLE